MADKGHDGQCDGSGHDAVTTKENMFVKTMFPIRQIHNIKYHNRGEYKQDMNEASIHFSIVESMCNCFCKMHFLITASEVTCQSRDTATARHPSNPPRYSVRCMGDGESDAGERLSRLQAEPLRSSCQHI
jgi:hypothetical protein